MGTSRLRSWRGGPASVVIWALLATAASLELYDEVPPDLDSPSYQDENSIDAGSFQHEKKSSGGDLALVKDLLLYKLIKSLERDSHTRFRLRTYWPSEKNHQHKLRGSKLLPKDVVAKRMASILSSDRNLGFRGLDQMYRPQQKWKIKKGKSLGNQMVCYFKLCAFRSPI